MRTMPSTRKLQHPADIADLEPWKPEARDRLTRLLSVPQPASVPRLSLGESGPGSKVRSAVLATEAATIPCWLVSPPADGHNGAGIVAVAGHGRGIDALIDEADTYHLGLALKLADAGFTVLCPELRSFGRRRTAEAAARGPAESSCQVDATLGLLTGRPVLGGRIADALSATRAVEALPGIDPKRVGIVGGSGGGAVALMAAALDDRVAAAVVGTYFSSFAASLCSVPHCICNSVPDLLTWFEMTDIAALIAPRPLIIEAGERDPIFPIDATRDSHAELVDLWSRAGTEPPKLIVTNRGHEFEGDESVAALTEVLGRAKSSSA
jgi:dienelactone hydrolase